MKNVSLVSGVEFYLVGKARNGGTGAIDTYELGIALDHINGRLTNDRLLKMTDAELKTMAYSPTGVYAETYLYPADTNWCRNAGVNPGGQHEAPHRALTVLAYRKAKKEEQLYGR